MIHTMDPLIIVLRLLVPVTILRWPLVGGLASLILDGLDWHINLFGTPMLHAQYPLIDKALDFYYLSLEAYVVLFWKESAVKGIALGLYLLRALGLILFVLLRNGFLLVLFPNIFENFFLFSLSWLWLSGGKRMSLLMGLASVIVLGIPKIVQEYAMHVSHPMNWQYIRGAIGAYTCTYDNVYHQLFIVILWLSICVLTNKLKVRWFKASW